MFSFEKDALKTMLQVYGRTPASLELDVEALKTWMRSQPHLPELLDDARLRNFLLLNKCSVERAKEKIDNYYKVRCLIPEAFGRVGDEDISKALAATYMVYLPQLTKDSCRTILIKIRDKELLKEISPHAQLAYATMIQEVRLAEDHMFKDVVVVDMDGVGWDFLRKLTPPLLLKALTVYEKIFSMRLHSAHILNASPLIQKVLVLVKTLVKPKIFQRINVHEDAQILHRFLSADAVPSDYGGAGKSCEELQRSQLLRLDEYKKRFEALAQMEVDESLRPSKLKNDDMLGFYGNFKKLDID